MASTSKGRNISKEGFNGKKRRSGLSESDDNASKCNASFGKKSCEFSLSKIYNSSLKSHMPAELFRKDLISAMKLPDSEQLTADDYWLISDSWKQEWEKGVQVPVNPDGLPETNIRALSKSNYTDFIFSKEILNRYGTERPPNCCVLNGTVFHEKKKPSDFKKHFKLPKKLIKFSDDKNYSPDIHILTNAPARHLKVCFYDMDIVDIEWLKIVNEELKMIGLPALTESAMELAMEKIENQCFYKLQDAIRTEEGLGIEYDDDVICDVCRSPDSEEGNEMVFCDACNVCVHQACYGITKIPEGSWVCRSCALGIRPSCILCPNVGGAMKSTRSGQKWTHVSCALWIPEVAIENVDKMEPITKISEIPASRWALVCSLCREKVGACIQCSVKTCKTAYHVTCAFQHGLAMKAIIDDDEEEDDVDLKSYCLKHTKEKKGKSDDVNDYANSKNNKKELEMSNEEKASARLARIKQMESEFYRYVNIREVARGLKLDITVVDFIYQYWILKRKANFDKPLVIPKSKPPEPVETKPENSLYARMKMFVHLRQDLERVRNLCYMVTKRERLSRSWCKIKRDIFLKQAEIFNNNSLNYKENEKQAILNANHGDTVYDIMSSCHTSSNPSLSSILSALGEKTFPRKEHGAPKHRKSSSPSPLQRLPNPYAKQYLKSNVIKRSQRSSTESCTEQDAKWKAMSENQKVSRQKTKDIANKIAALQEAYKLKPMEIVVNKLPEDHDTCLQFSKFHKRTNISPSKRGSRSRGSPDKVHSEPLNKKAKLCLNSRTKATKRHSKTEMKESISSKADIKLLPQNIVHNTYDSNREELGEDEDLINHNENEHFSNVEKKIEISNDNNNENEFHKQNDNNLLDIQNENNAPNIRMQEIHEINNCHFEENNLSIPKEDNDRLEHWQQQENNFDKDKIQKAVENYVSNNEMKNEFHNHGKEDNLIYSTLQPLDFKQEEQMHTNHKEKEIDITGMFNQRIHDINTHKKKDIVCNGKREENLVVNHKEGNEKHCSKTEVVNYEQTQQEAVNYKNQDSNHRKEENKHINHKKWENKKYPSEIGVLNCDIMCTDSEMKENKTNMLENEENEVSIDKEKNKKYPKVDFINDRQKECEINSVNIASELDSHNDVQKKHNDHKNDEKEVNCYNGQENHFTSHKQNEVDNVLTKRIECDIHKKCEIEFTKHKKIENQQYRREHELLKDVKVSVQRYMGGNIEEIKNILNTKSPSKEISVNSSEKLEKFSALHDKTEHSDFPGRSVIEDTKDVHFIDSPKLLPNKCTQTAILKKPFRNEAAQVVKKPNMGQLNKKHENSKKILSYEQKLMNSKRLRKEDIIIPAKPFIDNSKLQKSNERNKLYANSHKLKGKVRFHKKREKRKNATKHLNQPNVRCNEGERTPCKKPENSLISLKSRTKELVKDLSRHSDLEIEVQKSNFRDKKPQIIHEKLISDTLVKDSLDSGSSKEDNCKDACSKLPVSRHNVSPTSNNSEIFNKKFSPKSNMYKYNSVPEKLHYSPTSSNHAQSSLALPLNKDMVSGKEKLRQESAKIRESLFASSCAAKPLSGYKIPKKSRTDSVENNCAQSNQDTSKLSPLYGVCQISQTETYSHNGYRADRNFRGSKYSPRIRNGEQHSQEQTLLMKLKKDTSYSNSARWQSDSLSSGRRDTVCAVPNNIAFPSLGRNTHCDRSCAPVDSSLLSASTDAGGYWVCEDSTGNFTKHFPQNVQNGDYGLS